MKQVAKKFLLEIETGHDLPSTLKWDFVVIACATILVYLALFVVNGLFFHKWFVDIPSHIFLALLIALLTLVLIRAEHLKHTLISHWDKWYCGIEELRGLSSEIKRQKEHFERLEKYLFEKFIGDYQTILRDKAELLDNARTSVNLEALTTIEKKALDVSLGWGKLIFLEKHPEKNKTFFNYLSSRCFELLYDVYMEEERKDISGELQIHSNNDVLPKNIVATNYSTYLKFINSLTQNFIDDIKPSQERIEPLTKYKACIFAIANNLPMEWIMFCKRVGTDYFCKADQSLLNWRTASSGLLSRADVVFRRTFVTSDMPGISESLRIPRTTEFQHFLKCEAWYEHKDTRVLEQSYSDRYRDEFEKRVTKVPNVNYQPDTNIFFLSEATGSPSLKFPINDINYEFDKITLGNFLRDILHRGKEDCLRHSIIADKTELHDLGYIQGFPTDMLIIGVMPAEAHEFDNRVQFLMGISSLFTDHYNKISMLNFYSSEHLEKPVVRKLLLNLANAPNLKI